MSRFAQVQELVDKAASADAPADIQWHFIGNLQSNKVKQIAGEDEDHR